MSVIQCYSHYFKPSFKSHWLIPYDLFFHLFFLIFKPDVEHCWTMFSMSCKLFGVQSAVSKIPGTGFKFDKFGIRH